MNNRTERRGVNHDGDPHLFIDVLQQGSPPVLPLLAVLALLLQGVGVSEVGLGVDVVEAGLRHHQLPVHQLDVLEEGQPLLPLPPRNLLALNPAAGGGWSCGTQTFRMKSHTVIVTILTLYHQ